MTGLQLDVTGQFKHNCLGSHLLDLCCQLHQVRRVSHSVGLVRTNQLQPAGGAAALNQSHYT